MKKMKPRKAEGSRNNKVTVIALAVVVCAILVIGIVAFSGGGEDAKDRRAAAQSAPGGLSSPTGPSAAPTGSVEDVMVPPLSVWTRRNPFKPLINLETGSTTTTSGSAPAGGAVVTVPPELTAGRETDSNIVSKAVTLESIYEQDGKKYARMRVADQVFDKLSVGNTFAESYKLLSIGKDSSATILFGDERFTVFVGQSIYW